jgi:hypothetical protein
MGTTVYPAQVALISLLNGWDWPGNTPTIQWGPPLPTEEENIGEDSIYFGGVEITDEFRTLGASRIDEMYILRLAVDVRQYGDDEQATVARAWQLHDEILNLLRANMTLGGAISHITGYTVRQEPAIPSPQQWRAVIVIDVNCVGFITF